MKSFIIGAIAFYCFIGVLCHSTYTKNRLIESYKRDEAFVNFTIDGRRLLEGDIDSKFLGAATIKYNGASHFCSGSYVEPVAGAPEGKYVLTAAHCVWNWYKAHWYNAQVDSFRVWFHKDKTTRFSCGVKDIRINSNFPVVSRNKKYRSDYAILTLDNSCPQIHSFKIKSCGNTATFTLAGYAGTDKMSVFHHHKVSETKEQQIKTAIPGRFKGTLLTTGHARKGDSGGPMITANGDLVAVFTGPNKKGESNFHSVKITKSVKKKIKALMLGTGGITPLTQKCSKNGYESGGCWSRGKCKSNRPSKCFHDPQTEERKLSCNPQRTKFKYLCDPQQHAAQLRVNNFMESYYYDDDYSDANLYDDDDDDDEDIFYYDDDAN